MSTTPEPTKAMRRANVFVYDECINQEISFPELAVFLSEHYGQCAEDLIVASLLLAWSRRVGVTLSSLRYLEVGGNHPIATSATFLLNRQFAMRGVIVEANPSLIDRLQKVRPDDVILHGAVQTERVSTVNFSVSNQSELSSLDRSFVLTWHGGAVGERALITVPALRINEILETHFPEGPPAYLSIDVEGVDLTILEDLDWVHFRPIVVQAEPSDHYVPKTSQRMEEFMARQGYLLIARTEVNLIFMATERLDPVQKDKNSINGSSLQGERDRAILAAESQFEMARSEITQLRKELAASADEVQARTSVLSLLYQSRSWKVTAPLRAITRAFKRAFKQRTDTKEPTPSAAATAPESTPTAASHKAPNTAQSFNAPSATAVSIRKDFCSLDEFSAFAKANPICFDESTEKLIVKHCQLYGIQSKALGVCDPSEVAIIGPESREHLMIRGMNSRQRAVLEELYSFLESRNLHIDEAKIYGHEAITPLALFLRGHFPKYLGTEFTRDEAQKAELFPIPHADVCSSAFRSSSFNVIVSCDVFEHVQSIDEALSDSARILVEGGRLISTFPFLYWQLDSIKFATLENGTIKHLIEPPIYHGNPMDPGGGALVFEIPGWDLIDRAQRAGFKHTAMRFVCEQNKGICATGSIGEKPGVKGVFVAIFDK